MKEGGKYSREEERKVEGGVKEGIKEGVPGWMKRKRKVGVIK